MSINYRALHNLIDHTSVHRLTEKYKDIAAVPLDLPVFEPDSWDKFWETWNDECSVVWRNHIDRGAEGVKNPTLDQTQWDGLSLYEDPELYSAGAWGTKISERLAKDNPELISRILEEMPFVRVRSIRLWSAHTAIPAHYDGNMPDSLDGVMRFPTEIRIMLHDENPLPTFWITSAKDHQPNKPVPPERKNYVTLPSESNSFIWNNEDFLHGADYDSAHRKILVVIKGWVNLARLENLVDKSICSFKEHLIKC